jgi:hypothetical protein
MCWLWLCYWWEWIYFCIYITTGMYNIKIIKAGQALSFVTETCKENYNCNTNTFFNQECLRQKLIPNYTKFKIPKSIRIFDQTHNKIQNVRPDNVLKGYVLFVFLCLLSTQKRVPRTRLPRRDCFGENSRINCTNPGDFFLYSTSAS